MIRSNAEILKFDDVIRLSKDVELILEGELIWNKEINEVYSTRQDSILDVQVKLNDGWYLLALNTDDENYIMEQLWNAGFNIDDNLFKTNVLSYIKNLIEELEG